MGKYLILFLLSITSITYARDVRVMIIDTGIDAQHIALMKYMEPGSYDDNTDSNGHGTHIAGIIAQSNCPNLKIISCKFFYKNGGIFEKLYDCLDKAISEHVDIVNFSGGGQEPDAKEYEYFKRASDAGIKIIVAAGNDGKYLGSPCYGYFPACYRLPNMVEVGAINNKDYWIHSNYGIPGMKWQPGVAIFSTLPGNRYGGMTGTSQATAMETKNLIEKACYK